MNLTVTGRSGRMGQAVIAAIEAEANANLHSSHDKGEDLVTALSGSQGVIDFTLPSLTDDLLEKALNSKTPLIIGTCLLYTSPSPRDQRGSRMPSSA